MLPSNRPIQPERLINFKNIPGVLVYAFFLSAAVGALFLCSTRGVREIEGLPRPTLYLILIPFVGLTTALNVGGKNSMFKNNSTFLRRLLASSAGYALAGAAAFWLFHFPK